MHRIALSKCLILLVLSKCLILLVCAEHQSFRVRSPRKKHEYESLLKGLVMKKLSPRIIAVLTTVSALFSAGAAGKYGW